MRKSFTLIELLVVIAIIGLLSSIVLVAIKGAKERAELGRAKQFSSNIKNALGAYPLGEWSFDGDFKDSSGVGPNFNCTCCSFSDEGVFGGAVDLGDNGDCEMLSGVVKVPDNGNVTIELWIKLTESCSITPIVYWDGILEWSYNGGNMGVTMHIMDNGTPTGCSPINSEFSFKLDKWTHLALTYNGSETKLFVNGELEESSSSCSGKLRPGENTLRVGQGLKGLIDGLRIYGDS